MYISAFFLMIFSMVFNVSFAAEKIVEKSFTLDGKKVNLPITQIKLDNVDLESDVPPVIVNNRTLVPIRLVSENLGAKIQWDPKTYKVMITNDEKSIALKINSSKVTVNGLEKTLPDKVPAKLVSDRTMVPIRFISEELGVDVDWDDSNRVVSLKTKEVEKKINNFLDFKFEKNNDKETFNINGDLKTEYKTFYLSNPNRLVFDFSDSGLRNNDISKDENINEYYIKSYKSYYYKEEGRTRVTLTLKEDIDRKNIKISQNGNNINVLFDFKEEVDKPNTDQNNNQNNDGKYLITIDAGHGGSDTGAISSIDKTKEKDLTISIAEQLNDKLKQNGYNTEMVRTDDVYVDLKERANIANNNGSNIFVSIHINSATASASGIETLYYPSNGEYAYGRDNKTLANIIQEELIKETNAIDRKIKERPNLVVLKYTKMPAVLIECGFLSNSNEVKLLNSPEYQEKLVNAIFNGIQRYFNEGGV